VNERSQNEKSISVFELNQLLKSGKAPFILDVREAYEYQISNLEGLNIPLNHLKLRLAELPKNQNIVVHCKSGVRSAQAIQLLKTEGFDQLLNLKGGILAWQKEIDTTLAIY
jgi:adenylyltransferase/sulfurtransferase